MSAETYAIHEPIIGALPMPASEDYRPRIADGPVWLLEREGDTAGLIVLEREPDALLIYSIVVSPRHQGHGHATTLPGFAEREARAYGLCNIRLYTNAKMERNIAIYSGKGYRKTAANRIPSGST